MSEAPKIYNDADSRLKGHFGQVTHPTMNLQRTYCLICGAPSGYVSQESSNLQAPAQIVVTCNKCDEEIIAKFGGLPLDQVPTHLLDAFGIVPEPKGE